MRFWNRTPRTKNTEENPRRSSFFLSNKSASKERADSNSKEVPSSSSSSSYEEPSQFSSSKKRLFPAPPLPNSANRRANGGANGGVVPRVQTRASIGAKDAATSKFSSQNKLSTPTPQKGINVPESEDELSALKNKRSFLSRLSPARILRRDRSSSRGPENRSKDSADNTCARKKQWQQAPQVAQKPPQVGQKPPQQERQVCNVKTPYPHQDEKISIENSGVTEAEQISTAKKFDGISQQFSDMRCSRSIHQPSTASPCKSFASNLGGKTPVRDLLLRELEGIILEDDDKLTRGGQLGEDLTVTISTTIKNEMQLMEMEKRESSDSVSPSEETILNRSLAKAGLFDNTSGGSSVTAPPVPKSIQFVKSSTKSSTNAETESVETAAPASNDRLTAADYQAANYKPTINRTAQFLAPSAMKRDNSDSVSINENSVRSFRKLELPRSRPMTPCIMTPILGKLEFSQKLVPGVSKPRMDSPMGAPVIPSLNLTPRRMFSTPRSGSFRLDQPINFFPRSQEVSMREDSSSEIGRPPRMPTRMISGGKSLGQPKVTDPNIETSMKSVKSRASALMDQNLDEKSFPTSSPNSVTTMCGPDLIVDTPATVVLYSSPLDGRVITKNLHGGLTPHPPVKEIVNPPVNEIVMARENIVESSKERHSTQDQLPLQERLSSDVTPSRVPSKTACKSSSKFLSKSQKSVNVQVLNSTVERLDESQCRPADKLNNSLKSSYTWQSNIEGLTYSHASGADKFITNQPPKDEPPIKSHISRESGKSNFEKSIQGENFDHSHQLNAVSNVAQKDEQLSSQTSEPENVSKGVGGPITPDDYSPSRAAYSSRTPTEPSPPSKSPMKSPSPKRSKNRSKNTTAEGCITDVPTDTPESNRTQEKPIEMQSEQPIGDIMLINIVETEFDLKVTEDDRGQVEEQREVPVPKEDDPIEAKEADFDRAEPVTIGGSPIETQSVEAERIMSNSVDSSVVEPGSMASSTECTAETMVMPPIDPDPLFGPAEASKEVVEWIQVPSSPGCTLPASALHNEDELEEPAVSARSHNTESKIPSKSITFYTEEEYGTDDCNGEIYNAETPGDAVPTYSVLEEEEQSSEEEESIYGPQCFNKTSKDSVLTASMTQGAGATQSACMACNCDEMPSPTVVPKKMRLSAYQAITFSDEKMTPARKRGPVCTVSDVKAVAGDEIMMSVDDLTGSDLWSCTSHLGKSKKIDDLYGSFQSEMMRTANSTLKSFLSESLNDCVETQNEARTHDLAENALTENPSAEDNREIVANVVDEQKSESIDESPCKAEKAVSPTRATVQMFLSNDILAEVERRLSCSEDNSLGDDTNQDSEEASTAREGLHAGKVSMDECRQVSIEECGQVSIEDREVSIEDAQVSLEDALISIDDYAADTSSEDHTGQCSVANSAEEKEAFVEDSAAQGSNEDSAAQVSIQGISTQGSIEDISAQISIEDHGASASLESLKIYDTETYESLEETYESQEDPSSSVNPEKEFLQQMRDRIANRIRERASAPKVVESDSEEAVYPSKTIKSMIRSGDIKPVSNKNASPPKKILPAPEVFGGTMVSAVSTDFAQEVQKSSVTKSELPSQNDSESVESPSLQNASPVNQRLHDKSSDSSSDGAIFDRIAGPSQNVARLLGKDFHDDFQKRAQNRIKKENGGQPSDSSQDSPSRSSDRARKSPNRAKSAVDKAKNNFLVEMQKRVLERQQNRMVGRGKLGAPPKPNGIPTKSPAKSSSPQKVATGNAATRAQKLLGGNFMKDVKKRAMAKVKAEDGLIDSSDSLDSSCPTSPPLPQSEIVSPIKSMIMNYYAEPAQDPERQSPPKANAKDAKQRAERLFGGDFMKDIQRRVAQRVRQEDGKFGSSSDSSIDIPTSIRAAPNSVAARSSLPPSTQKKESNQGNPFGNGMVHHVNTSDMMSVVSNKSSPVKGSPAKDRASRFFDDSFMKDIQMRAAEKVKQEDGLLASDTSSDNSTIPIGLNMKKAAKKSPNDTAPTAGMNRLKTFLDPQSMADMETGAAQQVQNESSTGSSSRNVVDRSTHSNGLRNTGLNKSADSNNALNKSVLSENAPGNSVSNEVSFQAAQGSEVGQRSQQQSNKPLFGNISIGLSSTPMSANRPVFQPNPTNLFQANLPGFPRMFSNGDGTPTASKAQNPFGKGFASLESPRRFGTPILGGGSTGILGTPRKPSLSTSQQSFGQRTPLQGPGAFLMIPRPQ